MEASPGGNKESGFQSDRAQKRWKTWHRLRKPFLTAQGVGPPPPLEMGGGKAEVMSSVCCYILAAENTAQHTVGSKCLLNVE